MGCMNILKNLVRHSTNEFLHSSRKFSTKNCFRNGSKIFFESLSISSSRKFYNNFFNYLNRVFCSKSSIDKLRSLKDSWKHISRRFSRFYLGICSRISCGVFTKTFYPKTFIVISTQVASQKYKWSPLQVFIRAMQSLTNFSWNSFICFPISLKIFSHISLETSE